MQIDVYEPFYRDNRIDCRITFATEGRLAYRLRHGGWWGSSTTGQFMRYPYWITETDTDVQDGKPIFDSVVLTIEKIGVTVTCRSYETDQPEPKEVLQ